jgi:hypothetical protein
MHFSDAPITKNNIFVLLAVNAKLTPLDFVFDMYFDIIHTLAQFQTGVWARGRKTLSNCCGTQQQGRF